MRAIEGYEHSYMVTEGGEVWSDRRGIYLSQGWGGGKRYRSVCLSVNGKVKGFMVHRLVALAFVDNPDGKPEVNHIDGDRENNHASNLEWCTRLENVHHAMRTGLKPKPPERNLFKKGFDARRNLKSKVTDDQVRDIRERKKRGETYASIGKIYGMDKSNIRKCCKFKTYRHII